MYLPLTFKIQNFEIINEIFSKYHPSETFYQALKWSNGNWVMRYPAGSAVLFSPFYFLADFIAPFTKYAADGFSRPYQLGIIYGCFCYTLVGLYFIKKTLTHFFADKVAALTMTHKNWIFKPVKYPLQKMNLKPNQWNKVEYFYLTPDDLRSDKDKLCIYFFNKSYQLIYIDDLMLQSYEPVIDQSVF